MEVLKAGLGISLAVFLPELACLSLDKYEAGVYMWKAYEPKVYIDELLRIEIRNAVV